MNTRTLSLVFPLYNEEENLRKVIDPLIDLFNSHGVNYELILVDNGSRDQTGKIIDALAAENEKIKKVVVEVNEGYGWGIINGLCAASGDYLGYMGGDGQIAADDVWRVHQMIIQDDYDLVKVCRVTRGDGLVRKLTTITFNKIFRLLFGVNSIDINGSPKIFKKRWLELLAPVSKDWFLDAELMIKAKLLGMSVNEVPVAFMPREGGKSNVSMITVLEFIYNAVRYRFGGVLSAWRKQRCHSS